MDTSFTASASGTVTGPGSGTATILRTAPERKRSNRLERMASARLPKGRVFESKGPVLAEEENERGGTTTATATTTTGHTFSEEERESLLQRASTARGSSSPLRDKLGRSQSLRQPPASATSNTTTANSSEECPTTRSSSKAKIKLRRSRSFRSNNPSLPKTTTTDSAAGNNPTSSSSALDTRPAGRPRKTISRTLSRSKLVLPGEEKLATTLQEEEDRRDSSRSLPSRTKSANLPQRPTVTRAKSMRMLPSRVNSNPDRRTLTIELPILQSPSGRKSRMERMSSLRAFSRNNNGNHSMSPSSSQNNSPSASPHKSRQIIRRLPPKLENNANAKANSTAPVKRKRFRRSQSFRMPTTSGTSNGSDENTDATAKDATANNATENRRHRLRRSHSFRPALASSLDCPNNDKIPEKPVRKRGPLRRTISRSKLELPESVLKKIEQQQQKEDPQANAESAPVNVNGNANTKDKGEHATPKRKQTIARTNSRSKLELPQDVLLKIQLEQQQEEREKKHTTDQVFVTDIGKENLTEDAENNLSRPPATRIGASPQQKTSPMGPLKGATPLHHLSMNEANITSQWPTFSLLSSSSNCRERTNKQFTYPATTAKYDYSQSLSLMEQGISSNGNAMPKSPDSGSFTKLTGEVRSGSPLSRKWMSFFLLAPEHQRHIQRYLKKHNKRLLWRRSRVALIGVALCFTIIYLYHQWQRLRSSANNSI